MRARPRGPSVAPTNQGDEMTSPVTERGGGSPDAELKARHRKMWASGDYPSMVETWLLPLGPRLVGAWGSVAGMQVGDVRPATRNASIPAAQRGASVTASHLTPELLEPGSRRAEAAGVRLGWIEGDAE